MRKRVLVLVMAVVLLGAGAMTVSAQFRLDANVSWPFYAGINVSGLTSGITGTTDISKFLFLVPTVQASYQFGGQSLHFGVGLKAMTLIIESLGWPDAYLELELKPFVLRADVGGGWFFTFGLYNSSTVEPWIIPGLDFSWKVTDWFKVGAGLAALAPVDAPSNFGLVGYLGVKFTGLIR